MQSKPMSTMTALAVYKNPLDLRLDFKLITPCLNLVYSSPSPKLEVHVSSLCGIKAGKI